MSDDTAVRLRAYVRPSITDYGSIADHTFNTPPGLCYGNGGNQAPKDVFVKLCGLDNTGGGLSP